MEKTVFYLLIAGLGLILLTGIIVFVVFLTNKSKRTDNEQSNNNNGYTCKGFIGDNYVISDSDNNMMSLMETDQKDVYNVIIKGINTNNPPFLCPVYDINNTIKALDLYFIYKSDGQIIAYCRSIALVQYLNISKQGKLILSNTKQSGGFKLYCNGIDSNNNFIIYIQEQNSQKYFMESNNNIILTQDSRSATKFLFNKKTLGISDTSIGNNDGSCSCKNYCGFNWGNWNSSGGYNWSGASCEGGLLDDGTVIDCNTTTGQHINCICSSQDLQGFKNCNRNTGDSCNTGCPADNNEKCNC